MRFEELIVPRRDRGVPLPLMDGIAVTAGLSSRRLVFTDITPEEHCDTTQTDGELGAASDGQDVKDEIEVQRQQTDAQLTAALERGRFEGREEVRNEYEAQSVQVRTRVGDACKEFLLEREGYFAAMEHEVVKLAHAIAVEVLQRELKLDPLLLRDTVRVALEGLIDRSGVVLRVPMEDVEAWRDAMQTVRGTEVEIAEDSHMTSGECLLETTVGRIDLGLATQLDEVRSRFHDLSPGGAS